MNTANGQSDKKTVNGAIVGLGRMGLTHLAIVNTHPAVGRLSIVDSSSCLGRAVEKNLGFTYYSTIEELIENDRPDFMIVATPTSSHAAIARAAMEKGIHVFIEKPLSLSANESASLTKLAGTRGVVAQVGYVNRFNEVFQAVRDLIHSGELGAVTHAACEIRSPMVIKTTESSWRSKGSEGGGCLSDIATHGVDLLNYFVGPPKEVIGASLQSLVSKGVEDRVDALLGYDGFRGSIHVNWSDPSCRKPAYRIGIDTTKGRIVADQHEYKVFRTESAGRHRPNVWSKVYITDIAQPVRMYVRGNEFTRQLDCFIDNVVSNRPNGISGFDSATEVDRVIEDIRETGSRARVR